MNSLVSTKKLQTIESENQCFCSSEMQSKRKKLSSASEEMMRCTCTAKVSKPTAGSSTYCFMLTPRLSSASTGISSSWSPKRR